MKRLIIMVSFCMLWVTGVLAQDANRSGFLIDLQCGIATGTVTEYIVDGYSIPDYEEFALKGGIVASLDLGYRAAISKYFALGIKIGVSDNIGSPDDTWFARIMPTIRYTSHDFIGRKSIYAEFSGGVGTRFVRNWIQPTMDLCFGLNLSRYFNLGVFANFNFASHENGKIRDISYFDGIIGLYSKGYCSFGMRMGLNL